MKEGFEGMITLGWRNTTVQLSDSWDISKYMSIEEMVVSHEPVKGCSLIIMKNHVISCLIGDKYSKSAPVGAN